MKNKLIVVCVFVVIIIVCVVTFLIYKNRQTRSDIYLDKNGCAQSRSGGIHPDYCIQQ